MPDTFSSNMPPSDGVIADLVAIKLGGGAVDVGSDVACDLIVDLIGVYRPTSTLATRIDLTVSSTVVAWFSTVHAAQTPRREVSNLNVTGSGQTVANHAITRISAPPALPAIAAVRHTSSVT